jgi:hypothetical protein
MRIEKTDGEINIIIPCLAPSFFPKTKSKLPVNANPQTAKNVFSKTPQKEDA